MHIAHRNATELFRGGVNDALSAAMMTSLSTVRVRLLRAGAMSLRP